MKVKLQVDRGTSTALIKELQRAIEEATGLEVSTERRMESGQYYLAINSRSANRMQNIFAKAIKAVEQVLAEKGLRWERTIEPGTGWIAPPPLSETAEAYRTDEIARETRYSNGY